LMFFFINSSNFFLIPILWLISGVGFAGADLAILRSVFKSSPRQHDAYYLSAFTALVGVATALSPIIGGIIVTGLESIDMNMAPLRFIFLITFVARILCLPLISHIKEREERSVEDVLTKMKQIRYLSFFANIYSIAFYASKLVLFPQKQLFIMQRKTTIKLKKDMNDMMQLLNKVQSSLSSMSAKNAEYYKRRIRALDNLALYLSQVMAFIFFFFSGILKMKIVAIMPRSNEKPNNQRNIMFPNRSISIEPRKYTTIPATLA